jgi:hypothetical protein
MASESAFPTWRTWLQIHLRFSADPILERRNTGIAISFWPVDEIVGKLAIHCLA